MKLRLLTLGVLMMCLTSCFDVLETFNIKEDGSGTYEVKMDMSRGLSMLAMMSQGAGKKAKQKVDSILYYKSVVDTSSTLSAEEKAVLRNSYSRIHIDEEAGEMYFQLFYPYANGTEFSIIQKAMSKENGNKSMIDAMGGILKNQMDAPQTGMEGKGKSELPTQDFTYTLTPNSIVKTVKPSSKPDEAKTEDDQIPAELKDMMKMNFITTVNLPRPAKNWKGNNGTLSADKKQLRFNKSVDMDAKLTPADFNFSIDY